jgi:hypothetical protein
VGANVTRRQIEISIITGFFLLITVAELLIRCPWSACRYLNLNTYTITTVQENRDFLSNEPDFKQLYRVAGADFDCSAIRRDLVRAIQDGRVLFVDLEATQNQHGAAGPGQLRAWQEGMDLHVAVDPPSTSQPKENCVRTLQEIFAHPEQNGLSFLPRLFGGAIIHIDKKEKPTVFSSHDRCI